MTIAWFRPSSPGTPRLLDDTAALIAELARDSGVAVFDESNAHDFPWRHARRPFDVRVYELADTPAHAFVWPYLLHYPGVLRLRSSSLHAGRSATLNRMERRGDYAAELAFGGFDMLRAPVLASPLVVVSDERAAARLRHDYPDAAIRCVPLGTRRPAEAGTRADAAREARGYHEPISGRDIVFATIGRGRAGVVQRAAARARATGVPAHVVLDASEEALVRADVILALDWPASGERPIAALVGMSIARPVVVLESEATAAWPALDPQTWQSRGALTKEGAARVVSLDPRDEEHSLMLAMRRLASDARLRERLGAEGHDWWREQGTLDRALDRWRTVLHEARDRPAPLPPPGWPPHLSADGTAFARDVLARCGVAVDFLED